MLFRSYLTNLVPVAVGNAYGRPSLDLLEEMIYRRIGSEEPALMNVDDHGYPIVEGQLNLTLRDFARWSYPFAAKGLSMSGEQVIPQSWIDATLDYSDERRAAFLRSEHAEAFPYPDIQYHNKAWVLDPRAGIMTMLGIHGQFCYVDVPRELMIVGYSSYPAQTHPLMGDAMVQIWNRVTEEIT